jgi:PiT family inorganic phosphate transporter
MTFLIIGVTAAIGLYMAWTIGANDFANSMGDAVGSGALSIRRAILLGACCEFAGSVLVGMFVADTLRKDLVNPRLFASLTGLAEGEAAARFALGMACSLVGAAAWLHIATWMGMPVSTTHAIVGGVTGFGVVAAGWAVVDWWLLGGIVASWFISPVAGLVLGYLFFKLVTRFILGREQPVLAAIRFTPGVVFLVAMVVLLSVFYRGGLERIFKDRAVWLTGNRVLLVVVGISLGSSILSRLFVARYLKAVDGRSLAEQLHMVERVFAPLVVITSCSVAFAHGANDVANAVAPLASVVDICRTGTLVMSRAIPFWLLALGGIGIVLGLATYGYRVMTTIGTKITQLTPSRGVAADLATATTVLVCSRMKLPVSTTHTIVGAILGVGLARGLGAVNRQVTRAIFGSWLLTVPAAASVTVALFLLARVFHLDVAIARIIAPAVAAG